jgi:hypothetical protein
VGGTVGGVIVGQPRCRGVHGRLIMGSIVAPSRTAAREQHFSGQTPRVANPSPDLVGS